MLSEDEKLVYDYLRPLGKQFVSVKEVCRRAGGKQKYLKNPEWAKRVMKQMEKKGLLEMDASGHFRVKAERQEEKKQIPMDPRIKQILLSSGKDFSKTHLLTDDQDYVKAPPRSKNRDGDK